jgi:hypothetical protein
MAKKRDERRPRATRADDEVVDERQRRPRKGLEGKGFDAGGGYGGAGNASLYDSESSWGGQAGDGGSRMRRAYDGGHYGRAKDETAPDPEIPED